MYLCIQIKTCGTIATNVGTHAPYNPGTDTMGVRQLAPLWIGVYEVAFLKHV